MKLYVRARVPEAAAFVLKNEIRHCAYVCVRGQCIRHYRPTFLAAMHDLRGLTADDPATDQYTYIWKTNTAWENTCRQLALKLKDGSTHVALLTGNLACLPGRRRSQQSPPARKCGGFFVKSVESVAVFI